MHRLMLLFGLVLAGDAALATAQTSYTPPPIGTQLTWSDNSGGEGQTRVSEVVATGPDFAIHLYNLGWDNKRPSSYFAEFSGVHIASCSSAMPSQQERDSLRTLWPLQNGKTTTLDGLVSTTYEVGFAEEYTISQSEGPAVSYRITSKIGEREAAVVISSALNTVVEMAWSDGSKVQAIDVFRKASASADDTLKQSLGLCRALLDR